MRNIDVQIEKVICKKCGKEVVSIEKKLVCKDCGYKLTDRDITSILREVYQRRFKGKEHGL